MDNDERSWGFGLRMPADGQPVEPPTLGDYEFPAPAEEDRAQAFADNDAFWKRKIAEAETAGGSVRISADEVPPVPGIGLCLPSGITGAKISIDFSPDGILLTVPPA